MPIPQAILTLSDDWDVFSRTSELVAQKAESIAGVAFNPDSWEKVLTVSEFALAMLSHFLGTVENCGSFVDQAYSWEDERTRLKAALSHVGCEATVALFDEAGEVGRFLREEANTSNEELAVHPRGREIERIVQDDLTYTKLASFIKTHKDEILRE